MQKFESVEERQAAVALRRPSKVGKGPAAASTCGADCVADGGDVAETDSEATKKAALGVFGVFGVFAPRFTNLGVSLEATLCLEAALVRKRSVAAMAGECLLHSIQVTGYQTKAQSTINTAPARRSTQVKIQVVATL